MDVEKHSTQYQFLGSVGKILQCGYLFAHIDIQFEWQFAEGIKFNNGCQGTNG